MSDQEQPREEGPARRRRRRRPRRRATRTGDGPRTAGQNPAAGAGQARAGQAETRASGQSAAPGQPAQHGATGEDQPTATAGRDGGRPRRRRAHRRGRTTARTGPTTQPAVTDRPTGAGESRPEVASKAGESPSASRRRRSRRRSRATGEATGGTAAAAAASAASAAASSGRKSANRRRRRTTGPAITTPANREQQRQAAQRGRQRMRTSDETSAGGLVLSGIAEAVREDGTVDFDRMYVALIGRLDRRGRLLWSMPKGHVEPGEEQDSTAEREVWEETGIHGEVFADLGTIDYWFVSEGTRIHKTVHHFLLRYRDGDLNDEDPEVTEVSWVPVSELLERLAYADERKLARRAHDLLPDLARAERAAGRVTPR